jgi:hypothetical protein
MADANGRVAVPFARMSDVLTSYAELRDIDGVQNGGIEIIGLGRHMDDADGAADLWLIVLCDFETTPTSVDREHASDIASETMAEVRGADQ